MIIIYDFDGTLTPYSLPQYEILKRYGYGNDQLVERANKIMGEKGISLSEAYYVCYFDVLKECKVVPSKDNVCLGAENVQFNKGVGEFFKIFQSSKSGIRHYVITAGIQYYVDATSIKPYIDGVYGVTFTQRDGIYTSVDKLMTDKKKVDIIRQIQEENGCTNDIFYFGDGLTDADAFEYVHNIGGQSVFVIANEKARDSYEELRKRGIVDKCFEADFSENAPLSRFVAQQVRYRNQRDDDER